MLTSAKNAIALSLVSALAGFGVGWLVFHDPDTAQQSPTPEPVTQDAPTLVGEPEPEPPTPPSQGEVEKPVETEETFAPDVRPAVKDRTDPVYLSALARVEMSHGAWSRAEETIRKASEGAEDPNALERLRQSLSDIYEKQGRWDEVLKTRQEELAGE